MTIDAGLKPEGAPERSPIAGATPRPPPLPAGRALVRSASGDMAGSPRKARPRWPDLSRQRARPSPSRKGGPMFSSPSNTRTQKSSAFTPRVQPIASRRWSRSGRGCIGASAPSRPAWRVGSSCVTIMAPITCPAISRTRSNVWASKLRRPSCANPRAMASPSASSEP